MPNKAEEHEVLDCSTLSAHERKEQNKIVKSGSKMPKKSFMWTKAMVCLAEWDGWIGLQGTMHFSIGRSILLYI